MAGTRVAIIGAGKIGRHHAKWYHRCGCEVVGFVVSSPDHLAARTEELKQDCPAVGPGFASVEEMLAAVRPALVSVCSPAECHFEHAAAALQHGAHVLCEKPLTWAGAAETARAQARELVDLARDRRLTLATNLQYSYAAELYLRWIKYFGGMLERCTVEFESRGGQTERSPAEVWMELGPHALSLAFGLLPGHTLKPGSIDVRTSARTVVARFDLAGPDFLIETEVRCAQNPDGRLARRFGLNGKLLDYEGRPGAGGDYVTVLSRGETEKEYPDLMRTSIERMVAAVGGDSEAKPVSGEVAVANLEAQLEVAARL